MLRKNGVQAALHTVVKCEVLANLKACFACHMFLFVRVCVWCIGHSQECRLFQRIGVGLHMNVRHFYFSHIPGWTSSQHSNDATFLLGNCVEIFVVILDLQGKKYQDQYFCARQSFIFIKSTKMISTFTWEKMVQNWTSNGSSWLLIIVAWLISHIIHSL